MDLELLQGHRSGRRNVDDAMWRLGGSWRRQMMVEPREEKDRPNRFGSGSTTCAVRVDESRSDVVDPVVVVAMELSVSSSAPWLLPGFRL